MPCLSEELLAQVSDSAMSPEVRAHLAQCMACRDTLALATGVALDMLDDASLPPEAVGRYTFQEVLGRGGQALVLRVFDHQLRRDVALKELHSESASAGKRFVREARMIARLSHPAILPIYDIGLRSNGRAYYTMPLITGRTVRQIARADASTPAWPELLPHLLRAAEAVAYAHQHGIIHRDLTSANVLVGDFGETYVIDWGLAREAAGEDATELAGGEPSIPSAPSAPDATIEGTVVGTPGYMSPEQLRGSLVDERVDVWGLGAILYESIWARPPGLDPTQINFEHATAPAPLISIVRRALAANHETRYVSVSALADDIRRLLAYERVSEHHYSTLEGVRLWVRRNRLYFRAALALSIVLLIALIFTAQALVSARNSNHAERAATMEARNQTSVAKRHLLAGYVSKARALLNTKRHLDAQVYAAAAYAQLDDASPASAQARAALRGIVALAAHQPVIRVVARKTLALPQVLPVIAMAWSPSGEQLAAAQSDGVIVLDANGEEVYRLRTGVAATSLAWAGPTGELIVTDRHGLHLYRGDVLVRELAMQEDRGVEITSALFSDLSGVIATTPGKLVFFDAAWQVTGHAESMLGGPMAFVTTPDRRVVLGAVLGDVEVWDFERRRLVRRYEAMMPSTAVTRLRNGDGIFVDQFLQRVDEPDVDRRSGGVNAEASDVDRPRAVAQLSETALIEVNPTGQVSFGTLSGQHESTSDILLPSADFVGVAARPDGRVALASGSSVVIIETRPTPSRPILLYARDSVDAHEVLRYQCGANRAVMQATSERVMIHVDGKAREVVPPVGTGQILAAKLFDGNENVLVTTQQGMFVWRAQGPSQTIAGDYRFAMATGPLIVAVARVGASNHLAHWRDGKAQPATPFEGDASLLIANDAGTRVLLGVGGALRVYDVTGDGPARLMTQVEQAAGWQEARAWQGHWLVVRPGQVLVLEAETLRELAQLPFGAQSLNSVAVLGELLAIETMTEFYVWNLSTWKLFAELPIDTTITNLCLLDDRGAIGAIDLNADFGLAQIEADLSGLGQTLATMRVVMGERFTAEPVNDE
ncbi:MAG: protein kinase [Myxococcales bacterium]|nr:protein kinase [Myxococcales bacterium]